MSELNLAAVAKPFYLGYKDAGLLGVSCIAADNHLDDYMWYTLHNLVSRQADRNNDSTSRTFFFLSCAVCPVSVGTYQYH